MAKRPQRSQNQRLDRVWLGPGATADATLALLPPSLNRTISLVLTLLNSLFSIKETSDYTGIFQHLAATLEEEIWDEEG